MKLIKALSMLLLCGILLFGTPGISAQPMEANGPNQAPAKMVQKPVASTDVSPETIAWQTGPFPPADFQYARHDGAFVPGPALEPWANKVYFPGGRTSPPTESPNIWAFDPVTRTYRDTGADVIEDVSNYNANLVMNDGTGRGPAIYIVGGTNKDGGGVNIGLVQRYYPQTNQVEGLPTADNWNGAISGFRVACMGTAVVDDIIYVYGGWQTYTLPYFSSDTWRFDPKAPSGSRWTNLGTPLNTPRSYIMSAVQGGLIYAIGGVSFYDGNDLGPSDTFEVLDPANLAAGWVALAPMPTPGGEGRGFGFGADTLGVNSSEAGLIYVVAPNDWPDPSGLVYAYDISASSWFTGLPNLPTPRADLAGTYIPLCTADPNDGLPGMWTFGGRVNTSCDPPLGPTEYTETTCGVACEGLTGIEISGPQHLATGEVGTFSASITPTLASPPVSLFWNNNDTAPETTYSWAEPGWYTVEITGTNCDGSSVVTDTLEVEVYLPCTAVTGVEITGPETLWMGGEGTYTATVTPGNATPLIDIQWSNGQTGTTTAFMWDAMGIYSISVEASNCGLPPVTDSMNVQVIWGIQPMWLPIVQR